ncbi:hypothetical protein KAR91_18825 [Candidatus Pacearchaeota archaeon]|nr:hypothetical protein [Candidatus Pacearchaeota archaeon]
MGSKQYNRYCQEASEEYYNSGQAEQDDELALEELCLATCTCGYILPKPGWTHPETCKFSAAREEFYK